MRKNFLLMKYIFIPMILLISALTFMPNTVKAESRRYMLKDIKPYYLSDLNEDNDILYLAENVTIYQQYHDGYDDASYRMESNDTSVLEIQDFGRKGFALKGKKKGTAILTCKKYLNGKYTVLYKHQVVVGQPRFYTREYNMAIGDPLPLLDSTDILRGMQYDNLKYNYQYRPHDSSILVKSGTQESDGRKYTVYKAAKYGTTKVDIIEIYNGKEKVLDTITVNVRRPELSFGSKNITFSKAYTNLFYKQINIKYEKDFEILYESEDPSIVYKKYGEKYKIGKCGTTKLHMYCMIDGKKHYIGTSNITIVP